MEWDTKTVAAVLGPVLAVAMGAGNVVQSQMPPDFSSEIERWEKQLTEAHEQCDAREIRVRDYCMEVIERLRGNQRTSGGVASFDLAMTCAPWVCEGDYECWPCVCDPEVGECH